MRYILMLLFINSLLSVEACHSEEFEVFSKKYNTSLEIEILREDNGEVSECLFKINDAIFHDGLTLTEINEDDQDDSEYFCEGKVIIENGRINNEGYLTDQNGKVISIDLKPMNDFLGKIKRFKLEHDDNTMVSNKIFKPFPILSKTEKYDLELITFDSSTYLLKATGFRPKEKIKCVLRFLNEEIKKRVVADKDGIVYTEFSPPYMCCYNGMVTLELKGKNGSISAEFPWNINEVYDLEYHSGIMWVKNRHLSDES